MADAPKFIVDANVGKLAKWLRMMGYDTLFFTNDTQMVNTALKEGRIILTRDTHIIERRHVTRGHLKVILLHTDDAKAQMRRVVNELGLSGSGGFTRCMECNQLLAPRTKEEVEGRIPPYVFQTKRQYMECPVCHRIYWKGTHWQRMNESLAEFGLSDARNDASTRNKEVPHP